MNKRTLIPHVIVFLFLFLSLSSLTFAAMDTPGDTQTMDTPGNDQVMDTPGTGGGITITSPIEAKSITQLFQTLLDVVMVFAIPIVVFFIIYAGFLYVTARGNEKTIEQAHRALLYALIGGVLILGARVLIDVISGTVYAVIN